MGTWVSLCYVHVLLCVRGVWLADVYNNWLADGTPVFGQAASMWYPNAKGFCNRTNEGHGKQERGDSSENGSILLASRRPLAM